MCLRLLQAVCRIKIRCHFKILAQRMQDLTAASCIMSDLQLIPAKWSQQPLKCKSACIRLCVSMSWGVTLRVQCNLYGDIRQYVLYVMA